MDITLERLRKLRAIGELAGDAYYNKYLYEGRKAENFDLSVSRHARQKANDAEMIAILEAATNETVNIVKPEPEIPDEAIEAGAGALCHNGWKACVFQKDHLEDAKKLLLAALTEANWGGEYIKKDDATDDVDFASPGPVGRDPLTEE